MRKTRGSNQYQPKIQWGSSNKFILGVFIFMAGLSAGIDWYSNSSSTYILYADELPKPTTTPLMGSEGQDTTGEGEGGLAVTPTPEVVGEIEEKIRYTFGEEADTAVAIAKAESKFHLDGKTDDENKSEVECSIGIFQINLAKDYCNGEWVHAAKVPGDTMDEKIEWLKDPDNNILMAKFLYGSSGFWPWSVFSNGTYEEYL